MKLVAIASVLILSMTSFANAGGWGQRSEGTTVKTNVNAVAQSQSVARAKGGNAASNATNSGVNNSTSFRDRLQAPGFGVGGGYCSNAASVSFPGGGFGFSFMERMCKTEVGARVAKTYLGTQPAAQYVCMQPEFRNLTACRPRR